MPSGKRLTSKRAVTLTCRFRSAIMKFGWRRKETLLRKDSENLHVMTMAELGYNSDLLEKRNASESYTQRFQSQKADFAFEVERFWDRRNVVLTIETKRRFTVFRPNIKMNWDKYKKLTTPDSLFGKVLKFVERRGPKVYRVILDLVLLRVIYMKKFSSKLLNIRSRSAN